MLKKASVFVSLLRKRVQKRTKTHRKRIIKYIDGNPLRSFFIILGILLVAIIASNLIFQGRQREKKPVTQAKAVQLYRIGTAPTVTVAAQTKKSGVIQIAALTPGIVQNIFFTEGQSFSQGATLVGMSSNYAGGNLLSLQRQLAAEQLAATNDTYPDQKEVIKKQREIAEKTDQNADQLRDITAKSVDETKNLISLNEQILQTLDTNLQTLEQQSPQNSDLILSVRQMKSQFIAATNQARAALRASEFQSAGDKPPAALSDLQREVTLKQLDVQERQLDLSKEASRLQLLIAQVNEGMMFPSAPFSGTVQRVFVKEQEQINPGKPLMTISQTKEDDPITAVAFVSKDIADRASRIEQSTLHFGNTSFLANPSFISTEAVEGTLYAIYYPIPENFNSAIVNNGFITVDIPVGYAQTTAAAPFVPLDAVYQTRERAFVFVNDKGKAKSKSVTLGQVYGSFVEITSGIKNGQAIVLSRNVVDGDLLQAKK